MLGLALRTGSMLLGAGRPPELDFAQNPGSRRAAFLVARVPLGELRLDLGLPDLLLHNPQALALATVFGPQLRDFGPKRRAAEREHQGCKRQVSLHPVSISKKCKRGNVAPASAA